MDYPKSVPNVGLVGGKFVDENTSTGQVGSLIPATWGTAVTDEIINAIKGAGIAPKEGENNQLAAALKAKADSSTLGTAAALTATTSTTDATPGRVLRVADFGLGGTGAALLTDTNLVEASGIYSIITSTLNTPPGATQGSMLFHMNHLIAVGNRTATQDVITRSTPARKFWRARVNDVWGPWVEPATSGVNSNITALTGLTERPSFGGNLAWDAGNFAPSAKVSGDRSTAAGFYDGVKSAPYIRHLDGSYIYLQVDRPKDTALLTANGWSKNADTGEIIQRVEIFVGDSVGTMVVPVTWPFQFPNKCLSAQVTFRVAAGSPIGLFNALYDLTTIGSSVKLEELNSPVQSGLVLMIEARGF